MAHKESLKFLPLQKRELSQAEITKNLKFINKHIASLIDTRHKALARQAAMNAKVSRVLAKEFTKVGLDLRKIDAVCEQNSAKNHDDFKKYVSRMNRVPKGRIPRKTSSIPDLRTNNIVPFLSPVVSGSATSPFALFDHNTDPPNPPPGTDGRADANGSGFAMYHLDIPETAPPPPPTITGTAHVGFVETFTPSFFPLPGFAIINLNANLTMTGSASCNIAGNALSEGAVGWIVDEMDDSTGNIRTIYRDYVDQYYIDVSTGGSGEVPVNNPAFSPQITINTWPNRHYFVVLWFFGTILASGNAAAGEPWKSQAAGFGQINVNSFNWSWWYLVL